MTLQNTSQDAAQQWVKDLVSSAASVVPVRMNDAGSS